MRKIGILGGTFDPPHLGHVLIANEVMGAIALDEIRFIPTNIAPHKQRSSVFNNNRLDMLQLATHDNPAFSIDTIEMDKGGPSYTIDTIKLIKEQEPDVQFYFIIGADMIEYLPKWYKIDELMSLIPFVGVKRPNYSEHSPYPIRMVEIPQIALSSSLIRKRIKEGKTTKYILNEQVRDYIEENDLYGAKKSAGNR